MPQDTIIHNSQPELTGRLAELMKDTDVQRAFGNAIEKTCPDLKKMTVAIQDGEILDSAESRRVVSNIQHAMTEEFDKLPLEDKARIAALRTDAKSAGISDMEGALSVVAQVSPNSMPIVKEAVDKCVSGR